MQELQGWVDDPASVQAIVEQLPEPLFQTPTPENKDVHNHLIFKKIKGTFYNHGPQQIGDCVGWGFAGFMDYQQVLDSVYDTNPDLVLDHEWISPEVIYAGSRINIGGGRINGDGSVGAWAARFLNEYGSISLSHLAKLAQSERYSGDRARLWGARGMPANVLQTTRSHPLQSITKVTNFQQAAWHIQQGRTVVVCSNVGFGDRGTLRDSQGFARHSSTWMHCMRFTSVRMLGRPGLLCENQWPLSSVSGPMGDLEIPPCSWWVDVNTVNNMLSQGDSWTGSHYKGYPARQSSIDWSH